MPLRLQLRPAAVAALTAAAALLCVLFAGGAPARAATTTPVTATPAQVAAQLFVAGDVGRLSTVPSGTESLVLEKVLQQLYADNPALPAATAVSDIQALQSAVGNGKTSPATLTVTSGNGRILAILNALEGARAPAPAELAVTQVAKTALTDSSNVNAGTGQFFDPAADTLSSLSFTSFSPATVLEATVAAAAGNASFEVARNDLWSAAAHESLGDSTSRLLSENPALSGDPEIQSLVSGLSNGSFASDENTVLNTIHSQLGVVADQTCTPGGPPSAPGSGQPNCAAGALHDAELIAAQCPNGISGCAFNTAPYAGDPQNEAATIANETAAETAEAGLLGYANAQLQTAEQAAAQTSAQISDEENQYLNAQSLNQGLKTGEDVVSLVATLSVSEIDPVAAIGALFGVVNDAVGYGVNAPDPNMIIIQGLQNVSQQISDFEQYTQSAFASINAQLGSLSSQVAQETYALSAQLTNAQAQITTLSSSLSKLQTSVDQLQAEIQSLFASQANNDLRGVTAQYLGYPALNGGAQIPSNVFGGPAGQLDQFAAGTAVSQTVLTPPGPFDALDADTQLTASSSDPLDTNINYFDFYPSTVSDSPTGHFLSAPLTSGCAAQAGGTLCLPNPDYWSTATRAFAQLLLENPSDVSPARLAQLQALIGDGSVLQQALSNISANDAGVDANGTGSRLFDGLLNYYRYWAVGNHASGAPSLQQAIENETQAYLGSQQVSSQNLTDAGVDPWGGDFQAPDFNSLLNSKTFTNVPLCEPNDPPLGYTAQTAVLPRLSVGLLVTLPFDLLNAVRLGAGNIHVCWIARFDNGSPGFSNYGNLTLSLIFMGTTPNANIPGAQDNHEIGYLTADNNTFDDVNGDGTSDAEYNILQGWMVLNGQTDFSTLLAPAADPTGAIGINQQEVAAYNDPILTSQLSGLQQGVYSAILSNGSTLTSGTGEATNVAAAAQRLDGADTLLADYGRLGLPQALASDDSLQNLINGAASDVFAYPSVNSFGNTQLPGVAAQLVQYYQAAASRQATFDPAGTARHAFATAVAARFSALTSQLGSYIRNGRASGQPDDTAGGGRLSEASPLVSSTLDRLNLSYDVLSATVNGTINPPATTTTTSSSSTSSTMSTSSSTTTQTTTTAPAQSTSVTHAATATPIATTTSTTTSSTATATAQGGVRAVTIFVFVPVVVNGNQVTFTVRCASATCHDQALETVVEHLVGNRLASISSTRKARQTTKTVVVGSTSFTLAAGGKKKLMVTLNPTGTALLKKLGSLPVTLTVTQRQGNGRTQTIRTTRLVVRKGAPKKG
jgi:hypothetical protein